MLNAGRHINNRFQARCRASEREPKILWRFVLMRLATTGFPSRVRYREERSWRIEDHTSKAVTGAVVTGFGGTALALLACA